MKTSAHSNGGKQLSIREEETAPLLDGDEAFGNGEHSDDVEANNSSSRSMKVHARQAWSWFYYNGLVIFLAALLVIGTTTVVIVGCK